MRGTHAPRQRMIEAVAVAAPESQRIHASRLWVALDPKTDTHTCDQLLRSLEATVKVDTAVEALRATDIESVARVAVSLDTLVSLVTSIRLAKASCDDGRAFQLGTAAIQMLGFISSDPYYGDASPILADITSKLVLDGLRNDSCVIRLRPETTAAFHRAVAERLFAAASLGGGVSRHIGYPPLSRATRIDIIRPLAVLLGTTGLDAHVRLIEMLEASEPRRVEKYAGPSSDDVLTALQNHMVFHPMP